MTDKQKFSEPEITVTSIPNTVSGNNGLPIPHGHSRFYCEKCQTVRSWSVMKETSSVSYLLLSSNLTFLFIRALVLITHSHNFYFEATLYNFRSPKENLWFELSNFYSPLFSFNILIGKYNQPYDLPDRATTWRCAHCQTFNSITPGECEWCTIMWFSR